MQLSVYGSKNLSVGDHHFTPRKEEVFYSKQLIRQLKDITKVVEGEEEHRKHLHTMKRGDLFMIFFPAHGWLPAAFASICPKKEIPYGTLLSDPTAGVFQGWPWRMPTEEEKKEFAPKTSFKKNPPFKVGDFLMVYTQYGAVTGDDRAPAIAVRISPSGIQPYCDRKDGRYADCIYPDWRLPTAEEVKKYFQ